MRKALLLVAVVFAVVAITQVADADVYVRGYYRSNGTYVRPHWRSDPDGNPCNNWSTYPNVNPYTGKVGTRRYPSCLRSGYGARRLLSVQRPRLRSYRWRW